MDEKDSSSKKVDCEVDKTEELEEAKFHMKYGTADHAKMIRSNEKMFARLGLRPRPKLPYEAFVPLGVTNLLELQKSVTRAYEIVQRLNDRLPGAIARQQHLSEVMQKRIKRLPSLDFESSHRSLQAAIDRLTLTNRVVFGVITPLEGIIQGTTKQPDFIARIEGTSSTLRQLSQLSQFKQIPELLELIRSTATLADTISAEAQVNGAKTHDTSASHEVEATFEANGEVGTTSDLENEPTQVLLERLKTLTIGDVIMIILALIAFLPSETETKTNLINEEIRAEVHELNETVKSLIKYLPATSKDARSGKASTEAKRIYVINSRGAPLRSDPIASAKKLEQVSTGIEGAVLDTKKGWLKVAVEADSDAFPIVGWIHKKHLRPLD